MADAPAWDDLMWSEMGDLGELLRELPDDEFDRPSLCAGWQVRDVVGHMLLGHTTPMPRMVAVVARYRFNVPRASLVESREFAGSRTPDQLRAEWDDLVAHRTRRGISRFISTKEGFVDHTVHHQDIRRAVGRPRSIPDERLLAALDGEVTLSSPTFAPKKHVAGLHLEATDVEWSHGTGPVVRGTGEALLMAAAGRGEALGELEGDGTGLLAERVTAGT